MKITTYIIILLFNASYSICTASVDKEGIEEARFVKLGGIDQWITIRGKDEAAPILLIVHGGPGDAQSPLVPFYYQYEHDFILVQWDQRGAGKTYGKNKEKTPKMTLTQIVEDGIELAIYLKNRFERQGIIILGHSWGSVIATHMIEKRPDLFLAYIGTGQIASWEESVNWQFNFLSVQAEQQNDTVALAQLKSIGILDPQDEIAYFGLSKFLRKYFHHSDLDWLNGLMSEIQQLVSDDQLTDLINGMNLCTSKMLPFQKQVRLSSEFLNFKIPYYVIQGAHDIATPTQPVEGYFKKITAPRKKLIILEDAGHFAIVTHQEEFLSALKILVK